jgi:5'-3' exonuclease
MADRKEKLVLIDGNSLLYRAFFALPRFQTSAGKPTGATYGFLNMLLRILDDYQPFSVVVAFDHPEKTFRHRIQKDYKAQRPATPEDLKVQIEDAKEITELLGFSVIEKPGYEADDIIGSIQKKLSGKFLVLIFSSDLDLLQLLDENTILLKPLKGVTQLRKIDLQDFVKEWSIFPEQIVDCLALCGDPSDNIKGITGIGEKTALRLIKEFGSLDNLIKHIERLSPRLKKAIQENIATIDENRQLLTIKRDLSLDWEKLTKAWSWKSVHWDALFAKLQNLEFNKIIERLTQKRDEHSHTQDAGSNCCSLTPTLSLVFADYFSNQKPCYYFFKGETGGLQLEEKELVELLEKTPGTVMIHSPVFAFSEKLASYWQEKPLKYLNAETILFLSFPTLVEEHRIFVGNTLFAIQPSLFSRYWEIFEKAKENFEVQPSLIEFYLKVELTLQRRLSAKVRKNSLFPGQETKNLFTTQSGLSLFEWNSRILFTIDTLVLRKKSGHVLEGRGYETWKNWIRYPTFLGLRYLPKAEQAITRRQLTTIMVDELKKTLLWALLCCNFEKINIGRETIAVPYGEEVLPTLSEFLVKHGSQLPVCRAIQFEIKNRFEVQVRINEEAVEEVR